jgi:hypothetical protein
MDHKAEILADFPSNMGWWVFPAPHCVPGVVWAANELDVKAGGEVFAAIKATAFRKLD